MQITSDIVIEILTGEPYSTDAENRERGKDVRKLMEDLHWEYRRPIEKTIHGVQTTVALYERED